MISSLATDCSNRGAPIKLRSRLDWKSNGSTRVRFDVPLQASSEARAQGSDDDHVRRWPSNDGFDELLIDTESIAIAQQNTVDRTSQKESDEKVDQRRGHHRH